MSGQEEEKKNQAQDEKTKIFVPEHTRETDSGTKIFTGQTQTSDTKKDKRKQTSKPLSAEEASANYVRHVQQEKQNRAEEHPQNSGTIFCMQCGTKNRAGAKFCISCGAPLLQPGKEENTADSTFHAQAQTDSGGFSGSDQSTGYGNNGFQNRSASGAYGDGPRPSRQNNPYGSGPQPSWQNNRYDGPEPSWNNGSYNEQGTPNGSYNNGPRPSQNYGPEPHRYQNGPYAGGYGGYYPQNGPVPSYRNNGAGSQGYAAQKSLASGMIMKFVLTAMICASLLAALLGSIVRPGLALSTVTTQLNRYFPDTLSGFESELGSEASSVSDISDMYSKIRKTLRLLAKRGYSSITLAQLDHSLGEMLDISGDLMNLESSFGQDDDAATGASVMQQAKRGCTVLMIIELALIAVLAAVSAYAIYTILKSKNTSKQRGILCVLAGVDLVFLIAHLVIIHAANSAFEQTFDTMTALGEFNYTQGLGNVFNTSVGMLVLPLIFTAAAIVLDVVLGGMKKQNMGY